MTCVLEKSTRRFLRRIRTLTLTINVVLVFGSTPVFARGGGHGGGHSGGHLGHSGGHPGHHDGHVGGMLGGLTGGSVRVTF
jgi:hypothetical protein